MSLPYRFGFLLFFSTARLSIATPQFQVLVPTGDTRLFINGAATNQTGAQRLFYYSTADLDPLKTYAYDIEAVVDLNGEIIDDTIQVQLIPGESLVVSFNLVRTDRKNVLTASYRRVYDPERYKYNSVGESPWGNTPASTDANSNGPETRYPVPGTTFTNPSFPSNFPYNYGYSYPYFDPYTYPYWSNGFSR